MTIDKTVAAELYKLARLATKIEDLSDFFKMDFKHLKRRARKGHSFQSVLTDGVTLHVRWQKTVEKNLYTKERELWNNITNGDINPLPASVVSFPDPEPENALAQLKLPPHQRHGFFKDTVLHKISAKIATVELHGMDAGVGCPLVTSDARGFTTEEWYNACNQRTRKHAAALHAAKNQRQQDQADGVRRRARRSNKARTRGGAIPPIWQDTLKKAELDLATCPPQGTADDVIRHLYTYAIFEPHLRTYYGSRTQRDLRFTRAQRKRAALAKVVSTVAPDRDALYVVGNGFRGRRARKGDKQTPVLQIFLHQLARERMLFLGNENWSTRTCATHRGADRMQEYKDEHNLYCKHCDKFKPRDYNAACNIKAAAAYLRDHGECAEWAKDTRDEASKRERFGSALDGPKTLPERLKKKAEACRAGVC